jgi:hypothetical protein
MALVPGINQVAVAGQAIVVVCGQPRVCRGLPFGRAPEWRPIVVAERKTRSANVFLLSSSLLLWLF